MKILSLAEEDAILVYYNSGWSFAEIGAEIGALRAEKFKREVQTEVVSVIAHRFSSEEKVPPCNETFAEEIIRKRLARGDVEEDGILKRVHLIQNGRAHVYPKVRVQESC